MKIDLFMGKKQPIITITMDKNIKSENIYQFLKKYKFSNWKKGKFFLKRLIKKVFHKKSTKQWNWKNNFWDKVTVLKLNSTVTYNSNNAIDILEKQLMKTQSNKRFKDIINFKSLLSKKLDLGPPLFIQGSCINELGGDISDNSLLQIDGTRRLMASILINSKNIVIWLITLKTA